MKTFNLEYNDTDYSILEYIAVSPEDFVDNFVSERIRKGGDEIIKKVTPWYLDNGIQIPGTKDELINDAFNRGLIKTAYDRSLESDNSPEELNSDSNG